MDLYKILIVDDEEEIREGIIRKINWENYGFTIVGSAQNGIEALEKAQSLNPDIIMTDVKMPYMDGLELGEKVIEIMPSTKIIIFSGCDDFEYAQKAIRIKAVEYVLKPINSLELIEILKKLKVKLDEEYDEKRNIEILHKYYIESMPIMKEQFLIASIEGKIQKEQVMQQLDRVQVNFKNKYFAVGVISLDYSQISNDVFKENIMLLPISAQKILDDVMVNICECISFRYIDNVIIICNFHNKENVKSIINGFNEVCRNFKKIINGNISVGLGRICEKFDDIYLSYNDAKSALEYKAILGNGKVIYIDDVEPDTSSKLNFNENLEKKFIDSIKIGSNEDINNIIDDMFHINNKNILPINEYRIYGMEVLTALIKTIRSYNLNTGDIIGENFNDYLYLNNLNSIGEFKEWFKEKAIKANIAIKNERINSSKILVEKAKEYINKNYMDYELSVDRICSELHLSPAYFSTIFKKETNINFINFITDVRLEQAVNLLNTTDYKTSVIAQKVGYIEPNYFSYVFKKKFGIPPTRYRKR